MNSDPKVSPDHPHHTCLDAPLKPRILRAENEPESGGDLDNYANKCGGAGQRHDFSADFRRRRWSVLGHLWRDSSLKRVRHCRRYGAGTEYISVTRGKDAQGETVFGYQGLQTCASVWACPICSRKIQSGRQLELGAAIAEAQSRGWSVVFTTLTLRHHAGQSLRDLWSALTAAYAGVRQATAVRRVRTELGYQGYVRTVEITHGKHGWHPHIHELKFFCRTVSQEEVRRLGDTEFKVWRLRAMKAGLGEPIRECYVQEICSEKGDDLARYLTKMAPVTAETLSPAVEMSMSAMKSGRLDSRSVWQVYNDWVQHHISTDLELWHDYERVSRGKRQLVWSVGLRAELLAQDDDRAPTDEQLAGDVGTDGMGDVIFVIEDWSPVRQEPTLGADIINTLYARGIYAAMQLCKQRGIPVRGAPL